MYWRKRNLWKVGTTVAGLLFLLIFMAWLPVSAAGTHQQSASATPVAGGTATVAASPTEDATVTALNKEKLQHENDWWWNYGATILTSVISTLALAAAGVFAVVRYFNDRRDTREKQEAEAKRLAVDRKAERERRDEEQQRWLKDQETEREKRAEERFQAAVEGLSSEREEAKIGAAILLRTFLRPGYEPFYLQTFDLAVANLCLPRTVHPSENPDAALPLTILRQTLITVFKESFPLARDRLKEGNSPFRPQSLVARRIQLDSSYLSAADLKQVWMPQASLRNVDFSAADLSEAMLNYADLSEANLGEARLIYANLLEANLRGVDLWSADLSHAYLSFANLTKVNLSRANLSKATLRDAKCIDADFTHANLQEADLTGANLRGADLTETNIELTLSLEDTDLRGVQGLTQEQLATCKTKGAIIA